MPLLKEIDCLIAAIPWKEGDKVRVKGKVGTVRYVYYNGYTLIEFADTPITGGIFNNSSTYRNTEIVKGV